MSAHLTDRNGVVCTECFKTIDLAANETRDAYRKVGLVQRFVMAPDVFSVKCPHCGVSKVYAYSDVRPIAPSWAEEKEKLETKMRALQAELETVKLHNKILAEAASENVSEDPEPPEGTPPDSAQKSPTPPEGPKPKEKRGPYQ